MSPRKLIPTDEFDDIEFEEEELADESLDIPLAQRRLVTQPYDLSVKTLVSQFEDRSLFVPTYQREYVWSVADGSRLIESLLLNVPIPVLYFAEEETGEYSIIDGHQRVKTLVRFLNDKFKLKGLKVLRELNGIQFSQLEQKQQRVIQNRTIRCIVILSESHPDIRFDIFERLNKGAVPLNAQELRNAMYRGDLNELMKELIADPYWRMCLDTQHPDSRMEDVELVLRFFTLHEHWVTYRPPLKSFLDHFMMDHRTLTHDQKESFRTLWSRAVENCAKVFGSRSFKRFNHDAGTWDKNLNRALYDSIMITFAHLETGAVVQRTQELQTALKNLCSKDDFVKAIALATGDRSRLLSRLRLWNEELLKLGLDTQLKAAIDLAK